jgi:hypothetical protein
VRRIPPLSRSGAPKSTMNVSIPCAPSEVTADVSDDTSYTSAVTISGGTRSAAGPPSVPSLDPSLE